jgi:hypothetical protein
VGGKDIPSDEVNFSIVHGMLYGWILGIDNDFIAIVIRSVVSRTEKNYSACPFLPWMS